MSKSLKIILGFSYFFLIVFLGFFVPRTDFYRTITTFSLLFGLIYFIKDVRFVWLLILGLASRFILVFSLPELSDDYFRFVWDGILNLENINPYHFKPSELIQQYPHLKYIFEHLNSKEYYSVYPSVNQYIYSFGVFIGQQDLYWSTATMKLLMYIAEAVSIYSLIALLKHFNINRKLSLLYILNPLVILEFCGNLHFEGFMLSSILLSLVLLTQKKYVLSSISFSFAICLKIMPLMLLPIYFKYLGFKKGLIFLILSISISTISFLPFNIWEPKVYQHILESINLYFSSFEFNSSFFRIMQVLRWNENEYLKFIPKLITIGCILYYFIINKKDDLNSLIKGLLICQFTYLICSQSIHPWYILPLLPLAILSLRLDIILWSYLAIFTYITYQTNQYHQSLPIICLEYTLLGTFIFIDSKFNWSKTIIDKLKFG